MDNLFFLIGIATGDKHASEKRRIANQGLPGLRCII